MKLLVHLGFISVIALLSYMLYRAFYKDLARKAFEKWHRDYPNLMLFWPKELRQFTAHYRAILLVSLAAMVAIYALLFITSPYL